MGVSSKDMDSSLSLETLSRQHHNVEQNTWKKKEIMQEATTDFLVQDGRDASNLANDIIIVVMGCRGVGKSAFINTLFGMDVRTIGDGEKPCTSGLTPIIHSKPGSEIIKRLVIVDTPGFDDSLEDGIDILQRISVWMEASYDIEKKIFGFIYLEDISKHARRAGPGLRTRSFFRRLCGNESYSSVVLATTKSSRLSDAEVKLQSQRLKSHFWRDLSDDGSDVLNFHNTRESAWDIVRFLSKRHTRAVIYSLDGTFSSIIRTTGKLHIPDETIDHVSLASFKFDLSRTFTFIYSVERFTFTKGAQTGDTASTAGRRNKTRLMYKRAIDKVMPQSKRHIRKKKPLLPLKVFGGKLEWSGYTVSFSQKARAPQERIGPPVEYEEAPRTKSDWAHEVKLEDNNGPESVESDILDAFPELDGILSPLYFSPEDLLDPLPFSEPSALVEYSASEQSPATTGDSPSSAGDSSVGDDIINTPSPLDYFNQLPNAYLQIYNSDVREEQPEWRSGSEMLHHPGKIHGVDLSNVTGPEPDLVHKAKYEERNSKADSDDLLNLYVDGNLPSLYSLLDDVAPTFEHEALKEDIAHEESPITTGDSQISEDEASNKDTIPDNSPSVEQPPPYDSLYEGNNPSGREDPSAPQRSGRGFFTKANGFNIKNPLMIDGNLNQTGEQSLTYLTHGYSLTPSSVVNHFHLSLNMPEIDIAQFKLVMELVRERKMLDGRNGF